MDPKGKGIVIDDKEETVNNNELKGDKPIDSCSNNKKKDRKKKMCIKKIVYYDNDTSSSSPKDDDDDDSSSKKKTDNQNYSFLIILVFCTTPMLIYYLFLLVSPLTLMGKIILFGVIKCVVIYFSLHPSIWEVVENGMHFDSNDNAIFINEQIYKNA
jgi:hypothetical protein